MTKFLPMIEFYTHRREMSRDLADDTVKSLICHQLWFVYEPMEDGRVAVTVKDDKFAHDVLHQYKE